MNIRYLIRDLFEDITIKRHARCHRPKAFRQQV
jgi:hypothetical protein